jgi:hypothetical protein
MANEKKQQTMRFTDRELSIIKNTFAERLDVLKVVRKVMLQLPMTEAEEVLQIQTFKDKPELMLVVRKAFLPELDGDAPINQLVDLWMTLSIADKSPEQSEPYIISRGLLITYIEQQLKVLSKESEVIAIKFDDLLPADIKDQGLTYARLVARNTMIAHTEQQLTQFSMLAGSKDETPEETIKRLMQNSSK